MRPFMHVGFEELCGLLFTLYPFTELFGESFVVLPDCALYLLYCILVFFSRLTLDINIRSATEYIIIKNKLVRRYLQKTGSCNF